MFKILTVNADARDTWNPHRPIPQPNHKP